LGGTIHQSKAAGRKDQNFGRFQFAICSGEKSNGRLFHWNFFGKRGIPSEVFLFSRFYRNDRKILYHLPCSTSAMLLGAVFAYETNKHGIFVDVSLRIQPPLIAPGRFGVSFSPSRNAKPARSDERRLYLQAMLMFPYCGFRTIRADAFLNHELCGGKNCHLLIIHI